MKNWIIGRRAGEWRREATDLELVKDIIKGEDVQDRVDMCEFDRLEAEMIQLEKVCDDLRKKRMAENPEMWKHLYDTFEVTEVNNGTEQHSPRPDKGDRAGDGVWQGIEVVNTACSTQFGFDEDSSGIRKEDQESTGTDDAGDKMPDRKPLARTRKHGSRSVKAGQHKRSPDEHRPDTSGPMEEIPEGETAERDIDYSAQEPEG